MIQNNTIKALGAALAFSACALPAFAEVSGEYIEARSASVYAGACHYNSEFTTAGREAVLVWKINSGKVGKIDLNGLRVMALVSGNDNLAQSTTTRRSVVLVDAKATDAQRDALVAFLKAKMGTTLGTIAAVKTTPITYAEEGLSVKVSAGSAATLTALKYPCSHCRMPAQTWYSPFAPTRQAQVAQGTLTAFSDKTLGISWSQQDSDNVFVGTFSL